MRSLRRSIKKSSRARDQRLRKSLGRAVGIGLLSVSGSAMAQQQTEDVPLSPVDVRARQQEYRIMEPSLFKFPDLLKDTPQSIDIIPRELTREQAVFSMRDALRNVTGLSLNAGEGGSQGDNLTIRGFSARNDIYLDAIRDWGSYNRDVFNLQSIEVLKGPAATMFGRGSTGGVINQVSKVPEPLAFYDFTGTVGTGPIGRTTFDFNQPLSNQVGVRLNAMFYQGDVMGRDEVTLQRWGLAPSVTFGLTGPTRLTLSYFYQHESNTPDNGLPFLFGEPAPVSRNTFYGLPDHDFQRTSVSIGTARLDHEFSENVKVRNTLRWTQYLLDQEAVAPRIAGTPTESTPLSAINVNRGMVARKRDDSILANQTDIIATFETWFLKHTLLTGMEVDREETNVTNLTVNNVPIASLVDPNMFPNISGITQRTNTMADTLAHTISFYAIDEVALTPEWKIYGGARYDHFEANFQNRTAATGVTTRLNRTDDVWSPRAALVFIPTNAQTYYFTWGTSFNPSGEALTLAANTIRLPPEQNQSFELGAKWQLFENRLSLNTALFRIDKTDARTAEPGSLVQTLDGKQQSQGFEIELIGRPLPNWNVWTGYTYLDTKVLESKDVQGGIPIQGKQLIAAPENSFTLWTTYDIPPNWGIGQWQVGGGVVAVSQRYANTNNTNVLPAYAKGDLTVAYYPWKNTEFRLNVLNVSNARYFDQVYQGHAPPAAGLTVLFTGNYRY